MGDAAQRRHEQRQQADPEHDRSSCWCCCWSCTADEDDQPPNPADLRL